MVFDNLRQDLRNYPVMAGMLLAASMAFFLTMLPLFDTMTKQLMVCTFISSMQGIYWGYAIAGGSYKALLQETVGLTVFMWIAAQTVLLIMSYRNASPYFRLFIDFFIPVLATRNTYQVSLGIGVALHGCYDLLHYFGMVPCLNHVPAGYPLACAVTDFILGLFLCWYWS